MKTINTYIIEKLKINKDSKIPAPKKGVYGLHDNKVVDKIFYLSNIKDLLNNKLEKTIEE